MLNYLKHVTTVAFHFFLTTIRRYTYFCYEKCWTHQIILVNLIYEFEIIYSTFKKQRQKNIESFFG